MKLSIVRSGRVILLLGAIALASLLTFGDEVSHDFSSYLVQAKALLNGESPYGTYFDIKPPGQVAVVAAWISIVGQSDWSFYALQVLLSTISLLLVSRLARRLGVSEFASAGLFGGLLYLSGTWSSMPLSPELFALPTVLGSLVILFRQHLTAADAIGSALLLSLSGLVKESYVPLLLFLVYSILRTRPRYLPLALISYSLPYLFVYGFLAERGFLEDYLYVLQLKSQIFAPSVGSYSQALGMILFSSLMYAGAAGFLRLIQLVSGVPKGELGWRSLFSRHTIELSAVIFFVAQLAGLVAQAKPMSGHYAIPLQLATFVLIMILFKRDSSTLRIKIPVFLLVPGILFPFQVVDRIQSDFTVAVQRDFFWTLGTAETIGDEISSVADLGDCIHVIYGWKSGAYHHYSGIRPCSKHFLGPLSLDHTDLMTELGQELAESAGQIHLVTEEFHAEENEQMIELIPVLQMIPEERIYLVSR